MLLKFGLFQTSGRRGKIQYVVSHIAKSNIFKRNLRACRIFKMDVTISQAVVIVIKISF